VLESQYNGLHEVSSAAEIGLMLATGALAVIWIACKAIRREDISTDHVADQIGLALTIIASLMFLSRLPSLIG
jgi:hypothetical protein